VANTAGLPLGGLIQAGGYARNCRAGDDAACAQLGRGALDAAGAPSSAAPRGGITPASLPPGSVTAPVTVPPGGVTAPAQAIPRVSPTPVALPPGQLTERAR
jgi:hypothetical protein